MVTDAIREKIHALASQVAEDEGLELLSAALIGSGKRVLLRVVIDKQDGVTIGDCERMSRGLEALLDVEDPIRQSYTLEVSSPGLDRPLVRQKDFERSIGKLARITTIEAIDSTTFLVGRITDVGQDWIRLQIEKKGEIKDVFIPLNKISKARLEIEMKR